VSVMKARININVAKKARVAKTSIAKKAGLLVLGLYPQSAAAGLNSCPRV